MKKKLPWAVAALLALSVVVLLITRSRLQPLPAAYKGLALPTPQPVVENAQLPPAWLIVQDKAINGTLLRFQLSTGQEFGTHGDAHLQGVELAAAAFSAGEPVVIVGPKSITGFQAKFISGAPLGPVAHSLKAEGKMESRLAVFTLEHSGNTSGQFLRVSITFNEGTASGNVDYIWQLVPTSGSAPPPPCDLPSPAPTPMVSLALIPNDPLGISLEDTVRLADLIILGTVVGPPVSHWLTPSGNRHPSDLVTDTPVQVECSLKGAPPETMVLVRTGGGCVGEECITVTHGAQLRVGQRAILFLTHNEPDSDYATVLGQGGQYEVQGGQEYYTVIGEGSLYEVVGDEAVAPWYRLPLADLLSLIQSSNR